MDASPPGPVAAVGAAAPPWASPLPQHWSPSLPPCWAPPQPPPSLTGLSHERLPDSLITGPRGASTSTADAGTACHVPFIFSLPDDPTMQGGEDMEVDEEDLRIFQHLRLAVEGDEKLWSDLLKLAEQDQSQGSGVKAFLKAVRADGQLAQRVHEAAEVRREQLAEASRDWRDEDSLGPAVAASPSEDLDVDSFNELIVRDYFTEFINATLLGNTTLVHSLVREHSLDVNQVAMDGTTALIVACEAGHTDCAKMLLKDLGAKVNEAAPSGFWIGLAPLAVSSVNGREECVRLLLKYGATVDRPDSKGWTSLLWACEKGHEKCAKELLRAAADVDQANKEGQTPLMRACEAGHEPCVRALLAAGAKVNRVTEKGTTALMFACKGGHAPCALLCLKGGAHITKGDQEGRTALMFACDNGHKACVDEVLNAAEHFKEGKNRALARLFRNLFRTRLVVNRTDKRGETALMKASRKGYAGCVKKLLEEGAKKNIASLDGETALSLAQQHEHEDVVRLLRG